MITIGDVAVKAGVSKSSVSRVLNGNYEYMTEETKNRILDAIEELNYSPSSVAQSLKTKKTKIIGIILSDTSNPAWAEALKGVQEQCIRRGYGVMVSSSNDDPEVEKETLYMLRRKQVEGLIINSTGKNIEIFEELNEQHFPFVFLNRVPKEIEGSAVTVNHNSGVKKALKYLMELGHKRIGFLTYPLGNRSPRITRLNGYKEFMTENHLEIDDKLIKICDENEGSGLKAISELLSLNDQPTAILSTHIYLNLEALRGVRQSGKRIPEDISVFGHDDFPWVRLLDPPLSTVVTPVRQMGVEAASLILNKISSGKQKGTSKLIELEPSLAIRSSCTLVKETTE